MQVNYGKIHDMKLYGIEIAWCAIMLFSSLLTLLHAHQFVRRVCNSPKSAPLYYLALPLLAYACVTLFSIAAELVTVQRPSMLVLSAASYSLMWATRDQGLALRRCLTTLGNLYVCYLQGIVLGVVLVMLVGDPVNTLSVLLFGLLVFHRLCPNFDGSWTSVFPTKL
jgi:hypothetical protein